MTSCKSGATVEKVNNHLYLRLTRGWDDEGGGCGGGRLNSRVLIMWKPARQGAELVTFTRGRQDATNCKLCRSGEISVPGLTLNTTQSAGSGRGWQPGEKQRGKKKMGST